MVNHEELKSHWQEVKDRLQRNWGELSDKQLTQFTGTPSDLIGAIQRTTGASWQEVESFLSAALRECRSASHQMGGLAERYGEQASQFARDGYDQLAAATAQYSKKVAKTVKKRPVESLAIAFGVGIVVSAVVLLSKRRR